MADIVNLNHYRKRRDRLQARKSAAANRVRYGRTKGEKERERRENERAVEKLDDKQLD